MEFYLLFTGEDSIEGTEGHPSDFIESPKSSTSKQSPRPIGQKQAKAAKRVEEHQSAMSDVLEELKMKNRALQRFTDALQRASDIKIMTTSLEGLDETSKQLLIREKEQLQARLQNNVESEPDDEERITLRPLVDLDDSDGKDIENDVIQSVDPLACVIGDEEGVCDVEYLNEYQPEH